jgi:chaperonin cofactor prefoldin
MSHITEGSKDVGEDMAIVNSLYDQASDIDKEIKRLKKENKDLKKQLKSAKDALYYYRLE